MVAQAFWTSTSTMALRVTFLRLDLDPRVATSQTVATPYLRDVRTVKEQDQSVARDSEAKAIALTFSAVEHGCRGRHRRQ